MSEDHIVSFSLEVNVEQAYEDLRRVQTILYRTISILRRMGLPEDVNQAIATIQRLIALVNQARLAIIALQTASGPIGWGMALLAAATIPLTAGDMFYEVNNG